MSDRWIDSLLETTELSANYYTLRRRRRLAEGRKDGYDLPVLNVLAVAGSVAAQLALAGDVSA
jgi:hypothetical protein